MPLGIIPFPFGKCRICQDKATGLHYGVATCEGCKGFFKRSTLRGSKYKCYFGGGCDITPKNRNRCKYCRFRRCQEVGMALDAVRMGRIPKVEKEKVLEVFHQCGSDYNKLELSAEKAVDGSYDFKMNPAENILESDNMPCPRTSTSDTCVQVSDENANVCDELKVSEQNFYNTAKQLAENYKGPDAHLMSNKELSYSISAALQETLQYGHEPLMKQSQGVQSNEKGKINDGFHTNRNEMTERSEMDFKTWGVSRQPPSISFPVKQVSETVSSASLYNQENEEMFQNRKNTRSFVHIHENRIVERNIEDGSQQDCALNLVKDSSKGTILQNSRTDFQDSGRDFQNSRTDFQDSRRGFQNSRSNFQDSRRDFQDSRTDFQDSRRDFQDSRMAFQNSRTDFQDLRRDFQNSRTDFSMPPESESSKIVQQLQLPPETTMYSSNPRCSENRGYISGQETGPYGYSDHTGMFGRTDKPSGFINSQTASYLEDSNSNQDKLWSQNSLIEGGQDRSLDQSRHPLSYSNSEIYDNNPRAQQDLDYAMKYDEKINTVVAELKHETQNYIQTECSQLTGNQPSPMEGILDSDVSFKGTGSISSRSSSSSKFNQSVLKIFSEVITEPKARERLTDRLKQILSTKDKAYVDSVINVVRNELQNILSQLGSSTNQKPESPDWNVNKNLDNAEMIESKKRTLKRFLNDIEEFSGEIKIGDERESPSYRESRESNELLDYSDQNVALSGSSGYHSGKQEEMEQWLVSLNLAMKILFRLKPEHRDKIKLFRMGKINLRIMTDSDEDVAFVYDRIITSIPLLNERVFGFCEQVPNFGSLNKDDKGKLIKRAYYDIWMLTYSEYFQGRKSEMILSTGEIYSVEAMRKILNDTIVDTMLDFAEQFNALHLSDLEVSILCAVRLTFADSVEIEDRQPVSQLHTDMMNVLRYEIERNHPYDHVQLINKILKLMPLLEEINRIQKTIIANFPTKFKKQS